VDKILRGPSPVLGKRLIQIARLHKAARKVQPANESEWQRENPLRILRDAQGDLRALFADNRETHYVTRFKAVAAKRLQAHGGEAAWARRLTVRVTRFKAVAAKRLQAHGGEAAWGAAPDGSGQQGPRTD
jgi:hypothetical protein